jgi:glutathione peroxidase
MKNLIIITAILLMIGCKNQAQTQVVAEATKSETILTENQTNKSMEIANVYAFKVKDLEGKEFDFASLKGKKIMIVNTASKCGYTRQYADLQLLYEKYKNKNFVIIGFPANNFGQQEPGNNQEIATFCKKNYGVSFPMMSKISVAGEDIADIYKFLTQKSQNGVQDSKVEWNFQKYLIDEKGRFYKVLKSGVKPTDKEILSWLDK